MRKNWILLLVVFFVLALAGGATAFEGRMAGMADPYGLVQDDSDFFIHPSKIADGEGIIYYGYYKFTYTDVSHWNWKASGLAFNGAESGVSGDKVGNDVLVGAALPLGAGRFGLFFNYTGTSGDFDGNDMLTGWPKLHISEDADNFTFRAIYGVPLGGSLKFGAEAQLSYHTEDTGTLKRHSEGSYQAFVENYMWDVIQFVNPHDANYWDFQLKAGIQGDIGSAAFGVTFRGGSIFSDDNKVYFLRADTYGTGSLLDLRGNVEGYNAGGDIWWRYPVNDRLALPFLFKIDYKEKTYTAGPGRLYEDRIADGILSLVPNYGSVVYRNYMDQLKIEVGGGVDYTFPTGLKLAGGLYYVFTNGDTSTRFYHVVDDPLYDEATLITLYPGYPDTTEHQIKLRVAAEKTLGSGYVVRAGLEAFHGWVSEAYGEVMGVTLPNGNTDYYQTALASTLHGSHWGLVGSIGMTRQVPGG